MRAGRTWVPGRATAAALVAGAAFVACVQERPRGAAGAPSPGTSAPLASVDRPPVPPIGETPAYAGSLACKRCHAGIYDRWKATRMANVVRDPREHPDAVLPDLTKPDPLLTFGVGDIAFVYGSRWKQRYFKKSGDDYVPLPAQWDVTHGVWRPYVVKDDWWVSFYPPDNAQRPTGPLCDGCHSVHYDVATHAVTEWNVGCEKCHGPAAAHASDPTAAGVVNPARLDYVAASDTCIQCHSQGRPPANPIGGRYYDWPVGFLVGQSLRDTWRLEPHELGDTTFAHFADGTAHKNRMQGNDFVQSAMYTHGVTCFTCHDPHGSSFDGLIRKPGDGVCLDCHGPRSPNGPRAPTLEAHTHHAAGSPGSSCVGCHMPKIAQTLGDVRVRSHTFRFVPPSETDAMKIPNACNVCHADRTPAWATAALRTWKERSPWRVAD
ncbi:MAG TPA: cytochrome c3 family protein [Polyangiaceae bacterium]|jgi:predicted CXXCH cytochrome family protein|nr:cytochrome c3 family protein [Polyangiaceae bacterium]